MFQPRRRPVIIPPSTDRTIIFPYNFTSRKFQTQHYSPMIIGCNFSIDEVNSFLVYVETQLAAYHRASGQRLLRCLNYLIILFVISEIVTVVGTIVSMSASFEATFPFGIPIISVLFLCYFITLWILTCIFNARGARKMREIKQNIQAHIEEGAPLLKQKCVLWHIPTTFPHWVELWKDVPLQGPPVYYTEVQMMQQQLGNPSISFYANIQNPGDGIYYRPGQTTDTMETGVQQIQPMEMYVQPQQGSYMQNQYSNYNGY